MDTEEPEHVERIPWAELMPQAGASRSWITYVVIGALALGVVVMALTRRQPAAPTVTLATPVSAQPLVTNPPLPRSEVAAPAAPLYSEADLMAIAPQAGRSGVGGRAEWFVRDYFTAAASNDDWSRVLLHLPEGAIERSMLPRGASYVEWAQAIDVEEPAPGEFVVVVAFQLLVPEGDSFRRLGTRAVSVALAVDEDGVAAVRDLPSPAALQYGYITPTWGPRAEPPPQVASSALASVAAWEGDPEILTAARTAEGWRFVIAVQDEAGNRWPLSVMQDD